MSWMRDRMNTIRTPTGVVTRIRARGSATTSISRAVDISRGPIGTDEATAKDRIDAAPYMGGEAVSAGLEPGLRTRAFIYNTLIYDKAVDDRLRNYPTWLSARNLANEASDESVQALLSAVRARNDIPRRWYALKPVPTSDPNLNARADRLIGQVVTVEAAIENGKGRVRVGDGVWNARGPDAPAGSAVRVVAADGTCLTVELAG